MRALWIKTSPRLSPRRRYRRSAAPSLPYDMGRSPGALNGGARRRYAPEWEFRDARFEELESEDDDGQGVILDPKAFASRDSRARGFVSDELYFDGYDVRQDRLSRRNMYDYYGDEFGSRELEYRDLEGVEYQVAAREKEEDLIHSALERIARARSKGKTNVNLSEEEMEALERRRTQQPEQPKPPLASPPATPAKSAAKGKVSSRSNSSTNLSSKTRKRNSGFFGSSPSPAKSNSKAKVNRSSSAEQALSPAQAPARMMITGPGGAPLYALPSHISQSQELVRSRPGSKAPSRSGSKHSRRESTPPERVETFPPYPPRYYPPPSGFRPESSGSNRSLPDDVDWYPPPSRHRSTSNVQYGGYLSDYDLPAAHARRNYSGPADVRYSNVRRVMPASRPVPTHSNRSDPVSAGGRKTSGLSREIGDSSTSRSSSSSEEEDEDEDEDEDGVQVDILPDEAEERGYEVRRSPISGAQVKGNEGRKRSGRR